MPRVNLASNSVVTAIQERRADLAARRTAYNAALMPLRNGISAAVRNGNNSTAGGYTPDVTQNMNQVVAATNVEISAATLAALVTEVNTLRVALNNLSRIQRRYHQAFDGFATYVNAHQNAIVPLIQAERVRQR